MKKQKMFKGKNRTEPTEAGLDFTCAVIAAITPLVKCALAGGDLEGVEQCLRSALAYVLLDAAGIPFEEEDAPKTKKTKKGKK